MTDYVGTEKSIALQERIRARMPIFDREINIVNGGRLMHFLDPDQTGWDVVRQYAEEDQLIGFPAVLEENTISQIHKHLGAEWQTPIWQCLTGDADWVLDHCHNVVNTNSLPRNWRVIVLERPVDAQIDEIQILNSKTGVSPYPAYYMRSEALPVLTVCILNAGGGIVATASVADRYNQNSRLGGYVFAGNVSVSNQCRGKGLGKLSNALALIESHNRFNWGHVTEQVAPDNPVSRAMILACGLDDSAEWVSVAANGTGERFTR